MKRKIKRTLIYVISLLLIVLVLQINVLDWVFCAGKLLYLRIFDAFSYVSELEQIDNEWIEFNEWMGSDVHISYQKEKLPDNLSVELVLPLNMKEIRINGHMWISDNVLVNIPIKYTPYIKIITYEPINIFVKSEASDIGEAYTDEEKILQYLGKYNVRKEDIKKCQDYLLYDLITKSWTQAYIGNNKIEQMKLKCCIQIDNTFNFEDEEGK